jgi:hypothetical protein
MNALLAAIIGVAGAAVMFLPSVYAHLRGSLSFRNISALNALAVLTLVSSLASQWFLVATGGLWICAMVLAVTSPQRGAQPTAPSNSGPAAAVGDSRVSEGPPSVS